MISKTPALPKPLTGLSHFTRRINYILIKKCDKPLKGFGSAGVLEIIEDYDGDTYRAVYTVKFEQVLYILHCFQKKSKKGKATPKEDINLIKQRLKLAEISYQEWLKNQGE